MSIQHQSTDRTTPPAHLSRPFGNEASRVPSAAIGVLQDLLHDDLARLSRRIRRDGHVQSVKDAALTIELFLDVLECEAKHRDWVRGQADREREDQG